MEESLSPRERLSPGRGEMPRKRQRGEQVLNEVKRMRGMNRSIPYSEASANHNCPSFVIADAMPPSTERERFLRRTT